VDREVGRAAKVELGKGEPKELAKGRDLLRR
jgi:hypothetical protein